MRRTYRPDIDGLRALAVIGVVIFHAFPSALPGGFVGVDVFFVISGYLITGILADDLKNNRFRLTGFYGRRIRRIFPALLMVLCGCAVAGAIFLLPVEFDRLGQHIAAGAGFVSNFMLWSESGYFDRASKLKPLLHLWSLGIEEQFYIVWPIVLLAARQLKWNFFFVTLLLFALSFLDNIYRTTLIGGAGDPARLFYSPETRAWELLAGGLLAYRPAALYDRTPFAKNTLSLGGLGLLAAGFCFTDDTHFPGVQAVLPIAGCLLLIACGPQAAFNRVVLSHPVAVALGLISYPLYMWHWPLLSFARIIAGSTPSLPVRAGLIVGSLLLAVLTYCFVEKPIRFGKYKHDKTIMLIVAMALIGWVGLSLHYVQGIVFDNDRAVDRLNERQFSWSHSGLSPDCLRHVALTDGDCALYGNPDNITTAVIGDSIANSLAPGLATLYADADKGLINIGHSSCPPVRGLATNDVWHLAGCREAVEQEYKFVLENPSVTTVFLSVFAKDVAGYGLPGIANDAPVEDRFKVFGRLLDNDIADLARHGKKVVINFDSPYLPLDPLDCMQRPWFADHPKQCHIHERDLIEREPYVGLYRAYLQNRTDVCVMSLSDLLIRNGEVAIFDDAGRLLMRDNHHVGDYGSEQAALLFKDTACYGGTRKD